jgi:hypothetical protein
MLFLGAYPGWGYPWWGWLIPVGGFAQAVGGVGSRAFMITGSATIIIMGKFSGAP